MARARTSSVGSSSRTGKSRVVELGVRALVGHGELREPIDLVAPEVDPNRVVGGRGIHVDDGAAHGELAARLDLVLAAVAHRHQASDELVTIEPGAAADDDRFDVLDAARGVARAPGSAPRRQPGDVRLRSGAAT